MPSGSRGAGGGIGLMSPKDVAALMKVPARERARLASRLLRSLEKVQDPEAGKAWAEEVVRRAEELRSGAVKGVPWETVRRRLRQRAAKPGSVRTFASTWSDQPSVASR